MNPSFEPPLDRTPPKRKPLETFDSPLFAMASTSGSNTEQSDHNMLLVQSMTERFEMMMKNQQDFFMAQLMEQRGNQVQRAPMRNYYNPGAYEQRQGIHYPELGINFELKPAFLNLLPTFKGLPNEDPYDHIEEFEKACDTISIAGVPKDAIRLRAFPYTLKESAHHWCKMLEERIEEWGTLKDRFLRKYFPVGKQNALRNVIETFSQLPNERFYETWDRFKEAIRKCPTHGIQKHRLIEYFYIGLTF